MSLPCKQARNTDFSGVVFMGRAFSFLERKKKEDRKVSFQGSLLFQDSQCIFVVFCCLDQTKAHPQDGNGGKN